jgi:hypothetical protein
VTDERAVEIVETLRMFARLDAESLVPTHPDDTEKDLLLSWYPQLVARLRQSADFSTYVPNAMKWTRMADELEQWAREEDRKGSQ